MATALIFRINQVDAAVPFATTPADYLTVDLTDDKLIWTTGDTVVKNHMTDNPTAGELNAAATIIDDALAVTVPLCLYNDYDGVSGFFTHTVIGMGIDGRYVFCFSFDNPTATIPRLEAWDTSAHSTAVLNVLGLGIPANSFVKAIKTTDATPGAGWVAAGSGTAIAGASNYLNLDSAALSGAKALYCNIAIRIPITAIPSAEAFVLTCRYTYL
jgi:hypothetical protein